MKCCINLLFLEERKNRIVFVKHMMLLSLLICCGLNVRETQLAKYDQSPEHPVSIDGRCTGKFAS